MNKKILVIDDEAIVIQMTKSVLTKRGYEVTTSSCAEDALKSLTEAKPDLIILDHLLPGKNGNEFCQEVKSHSETFSIPILMTTGHNIIEETLNQNQKNFGPDDMLVKPFEIDDLIKKVEKLLAK